MKETLFLLKDEKDANQLYLFLLAANYHGQVLKNNHQVKIVSSKKETETLIVELIYPFIIDLFVPRIAKKILKQSYYYEDGEIEQIIPYVLSVSPLSKSLHSRLNFSLYERLTYLLHNQYLASIIDMTELYETLFEKEESWIEIVGYGIEEWQVELSFQEKMNDMRQYVLHRKSKYSAITIYLNDHVTFFDEDGRLIEEAELRQFQKNVITSPFEEYEHSFLVSTLLSMAPRKIDVYASNEHLHTLYWLLNIFQEKMRLHSDKQFPYKIAE